MCACVYKCECISNGAFEFDFKYFKKMKLYLVITFNGVFISVVKCYGHMIRVIPCRRRKNDLHNMIPERKGILIILYFVFCIQTLKILHNVPNIIQRTEYF